MHRYDERIVQLMAMSNEMKLAFDKIVVKFGEDVKTESEVTLRFIILRRLGVAVLPDFSYSSPKPT